MVDLTSIDLSKINPSGIIEFISNIPTLLMNYDYTKLWWLWLILGLLGLGVLIYQLYLYIHENE